jgi:glycosyltransferase involved in cell wall biosynthesis
MDKKVLIISYYWPPSGGSGVQRWLKFVKYLPQFGWEPFVFTPENPSYSSIDESLIKDVPPEAEVIKFPIWEPYALFQSMNQVTGGRDKTKPADVVSGKQRSLFQRISTWIRGNFFIPDPRVFWVRPSAQFLLDFIRDNKITTVITTGPPHSIHLIGLRVKKKNPSIKWIADFRDPWSEWELLEVLKLSSVAKQLHKRLEAKVLRHADRIVTITPFFVNRFEMLSKRKVNLITNGFDHEDFQSLEIVRPEKFVIRHVGIVIQTCNPRPFMKAVLSLMEENPSFRSNVLVDFVGEVHADFKKFVFDEPSLSRVTSFAPAVPHSKLIPLYGTSSLLLLILTGYKNAEGYMPGKLFEYIATGIPVLGVGPENGDAAALLRETHSGEMFDDQRMENIKAYLLENFLRWEKGIVPKANKGAEIYSRQSITQKLTQLL